MSETSEMTVTVSGKEHTIDSCKAMRAIEAIGILAKYAKHLAPVIRKSVEMAESAGNDDSKYTDYVIDSLTALSPILEKPEDIIRFASVLSGIDQEILANCDFTELVEVFRAVFRKNNIASMMTLATKNA